MTNISKCLVVLAAVASLAFLGVVSVSSVGGPNFEAQFEDPTLSGIAFSEKMDEETGKVTYSAQTRRKRPSDPNNPNSEYVEKKIETDSKVLPRVLIKAREFVAQEQKLREEELDLAINGGQKNNRPVIGLKKKIENAKKLIAMDIQAMEKRLTDLKTQFEAAYKTLEGLNAQAVTAATDTLSKRREAKRRRQEIERLRNQVEDLKADQFRLLEQKRKLEVLLVRLVGINERLERRRQNLIKQGARSDYDKKPAPAN
ncbi:MAG: hypothetical protein Tsb009_13240 [Planctomycetaceae bacterium]